MNQILKKEILKTLMLPIPKGLHIVERSIPICFFGNINKAEVATISLNPSNLEFEDTHYGLFTADKKRFIDREILGVKDDETLDANQAEQVYNSLCNYFYNRPYNVWFGPFDYIMQTFGVSFYDGTLINLDLAPWATYHKWRDLSEDEKMLLIGDFSVKSIISKGFKGLFINGKTALNEIRKRIPELKINSYPTRTFSLGKRPWEIYVGNLSNCKVIATNLYIQQEKMTAEQKELLKEQIKIFLL